MDKNMLGEISLAEVAGLMRDLWDKMTGSEAATWISALKKFLRHENPWFENETKTEKQVSPPIQRWRPLSDTAIEVNLDAPLILPFGGAVPEWQPPPGRGWVKVERIGEDLFVGDRKVIRHLEPEQKSGTIQGHNLRVRLQNHHTLDPRIMDALVKFENGRLIPDSGKRDEEGRTLYHYFWAVGFRVRGALCVRSLFWYDGQWERYYYWLVYDWDYQNPTLILASPSA